MNVGIFYLTAMIHVIFCILYKKTVSKKTYFLVLEKSIKTLRYTNEKDYQSNTPINRDYAPTD